MVAKASDSEGIWKYSRVIMGVLAGLFVVSIGADAMLWYVVHKSATAQRTLNEIVASETAPRTPEEKINRLDGLVAEHAEAVAQAAQPSQTNKTKTPTDTQISTQQKIDLLNSLIKK